MEMDSITLFNNWNNQKKKLSTKEGDFKFDKRQVWWCFIGKNIGNEVNGKGDKFKRPVLILKKLSDSSCVAIPITTKEKNGTWFQYIEFNHEPRWAILNQIKMISSKRFERRLGEISENDFELVKEKLKRLLELF